MKKIFLSVLLFVLVSPPAFAAKEKDSDFILINKISKNPKIIEAIGLMKHSPARESYNIILGQNSTNKPIKIMFMDLSKLNFQYATYDAVGWLRSNRLYIYVNTKHNNAPPEALCALLAGRAINQDPYDSKNEEVYIGTLEAVTWDYFLQQNSVLATSNASLVTNRENQLNQLWNKSNADVSCLEKTVRASGAYRNLKDESPGFTNNEFIQKMNSLLAK